MAVDPRVEDVLDFLTSRGFSRAAAALRDDALARGAGLDLDLDLHESRPPPVRVITESRRVSSSSSSSDAFVSMGSSPSELLNPSALWSPPRARSEDSSVRHSEFGTARDYHDPNLFDHTQWYDDQFDFYLNDTHFFTPSTAGCPREDKFVMSIEAEEQFKTGRNFVDNKHYCSFPACNCCGGSKEHRACGQSRNPSSSVYERYLIMDDQTERLEECGVSQYQCKQLHVDSICDQKLLQEKKSLEPDSGSTSDRNDGISSKYILKESFLEVMNDQVLRRDGNLHNFEKKTIQPGRDDSNHTRDQGTNTKEFHDPGLAGIWDEDHRIIDEHQVSNFPEDEYEIFDLRIIHRKNRTGFEENKDLPIVLNSVIGGRYYVTEYLGSAAFSRVVQAHDLHTGVNVCLKIIKNDKDFFDQSLDEIKLLKVVNRNDPADERHMLRLYDYFYHQEHLFIICELLRANLYEFQKYNQESGGEVYFTLPRIQAIARQCLEALEYLHRLGIIHCDLKPENILIKSYSKCEIKVIDLGSSCFQTDNLCLYVQSRSYRAPEVILGLSYDKKIDLWSLGCILAELYSGDVLFPNESLVMMLARMVGILGPIDMEMLSTGLETHKYFTDQFDLYHRNEETDEIEYLMPEKSSLAWELQVSDILFLDFLEHLLQINPRRRLTATEALQHPWLSISYH